MQYDDLHYELHYIAKEQENIVSENFFNIRNQDKNFFVKPLDLETIHSLTKDSPIHLLRALYACKSFAICKENNQSFITQENASKILGYKFDFANIFVYGKNSLGDEYLEARKTLYKTMMNLRKEREQEHKEEQERISQLSYEEYTQQKRVNKRNAKNAKNLILESKDKSKRIIFLDKLDSNTLHISMSNLIHIHDNKIDIFTKDNTTLDIQELESLITNYKQRYTESNNTESSNQESHIDYNQESKLTLDSLHSSNTQIFLYSQLLLGSKESPNNPLFFGELDSKDSNLGLDTLKPIYHLIGEIDYNTKDSKESFTQTLQVFLGSNTLTLLNYSLLDSSLNAFSYKLVYNA